jgi:hypothetical protein
MTDCPRGYSMMISALLFMIFLQSSTQAPATDLDRFMAKVLEHRKINQEVLKDYVLNDVEQFEASAPGEYTLFRDKREYVWYVREGIHVRSPLRFNGVTISNSEKKQYEDKWIKEEQQKQKKK